MTTFPFWWEYVLCKTRRQPFVKIPELTTSNCHIVFIKIGDNNFLRPTLKPLLTCGWQWGSWQFIYERGTIWIFHLKSSVSKRLIMQILTEGKTSLYVFLLILIPWKPVWNQILYFNKLIGLTIKNWTPYLLPETI